LRTFRTLTRTRSRFSGFSKKSLAPSLIAATASWTVAWPLMTITGSSRVASSRRRRSRASMPLIPGSFTSKMHRSMGVSARPSSARASSAEEASWTW
jgi:hypothetical protein